MVKRIVGPYKHLQSGLRESLFRGKKKVLELLKEHTMRNKWNMNMPYKVL
jgi:hypothetical protein